MNIKVNDNVKSRSFKFQNVYSEFEYTVPLMFEGDNPRV